tara:strand:- start:78 stop:344 length:267 start_codon:yes stop_codon:yes gene_type:complete
MTRTPDQIRDHAVKWFNQVAPPKYDDGQRRKEVTNNLDKHPNLIEAIGEELIDGIFYLRSLAYQLDEKELKIEELEKQVKYYKELAGR